MSGNGFFYLCVPEPTIPVIEAIARRTGQSFASVISDAITVLAEKHGIAVGEKDDPREKQNSASSQK